MSPAPISFPITGYPREQVVSAAIDALGAALTARLGAGAWEIATTHDWGDDGRRWSEVHTLTARQPGRALIISHRFGGDDMRGGGGSFSVSVNMRGGEGEGMLAVHSDDQWRYMSGDLEAFEVLRDVCAAL
jgi:hypothetical protein